MINSDGLIELSDAPEWKVADGDCDVRGWTVHCSSLEAIGIARELLVDTFARKARYIVVALGADAAHPEGDHVIIPVGVIEIDERADRLLVPSLKRSQVATLPVYDGDAFDRAYEDAVRACFGGTCDSAEDPERDYYDHPHFDDTRMYARRRPTDRKA